MVVCPALPLSTNGLLARVGDRGGGGGFGTQAEQHRCALTFGRRLCVEVDQVVEQHVVRLPGVHLAVLILRATSPEFASAKRPAPSDASGKMGVGRPCDRPVEPLTLERDTVEPVGRPSNPVFNTWTMAMVSRKLVSFFRTLSPVTRRGRRGSILLAGQRTDLCT